MGDGDNKSRPASPFAALASLREKLPPGVRDEPVSKATPAADGLGGKIVVARSKKGRGGKTVTTVTGVRADHSALEALAHDLRRALGCGATVEDAVLIVQGDQVPRVRAFLEARGARKVVLGS